MSLEQRSIVEVYFQFPDNRQSGPHMVVVLSCNESIDYEDSFLGAVITSKENDDDNSFWIDDSMLTKPLTLRSQVRLHLINVFPCAGVRTFNNFMRAIHFKELLRRINELTFGYTVESLAE